MKNFFLAIVICFLGTSIFGQSNYWKIEQSKSTETVVFSILELEEIRTALEVAPRFNYQVSKNGNGVEIQFPESDGTLESYEVYKTSVMHPDLEAKFPMIRTYIGMSQENPGKVVRFSISHKRLSAMVTSPTEEDVYIHQLEKNTYQTYKVSDYPGERKTDQVFSCGVTGSSIKVDKSKTGTNENKSLAGDCNLRTYRLALACTGEYAQFHGGTTASVMDAFVTAMTRVNGIYETDLGISMQLVPNNDDLIFFVGASDPYTNNNGGAMLGQNQDTVDDIIGSANYDIGHVFSTGGGGIAQLNAPCNPNRKAQGVTGLGNPDGDPFWVDYVAHEIGHQFGGNHTMNNACNGARNNATAMEPGSASTIMGYAGICNPNVQNNSDDHFHAISLQEMTEYTTEGNGNSCPVIMNTGNTAPVIAPQNTAFVLPVDTPFRLGMSASDEDENDVLTYCWEQMDNEVADMPPSPSNTQGPAFRSISPHLDPYRYFPNIQSILNNTSPTWEVLPILSRDMSFRGTVRDNHPLNGCTDEVDVFLIFDENAGPFRVTSQSEPEEWYSGTSQLVTWDVAGTDIMSPNPATMVDVFFSEDGGMTYPHTIATNLPNTGEAMIVAPFVETTRGRIMVQGSDNVFFDINDRNITVNPTDFLISVDPSTIETCDSDVADFLVNIDALPALMETIELSLENVPTELNVSLSENSVTEDIQIMGNISGISQLNPGIYAFEVVGMTSTIEVSETITLEVLNSVLAEPFLETPAEGETGVSIRPEFKWISSDNVQIYELEVATSQTFGSSVVVYDPDAASGELLDGILELNTLYYWRVFASNSCATEKANSKIYKFKTGIENCELVTGIGLPVQITQNSAGVARALGNVTLSNSQTSRINVIATIVHTNIGDLGISLQSPSGTRIELMDRPGFPASTLGCTEDNADLIFSDSSNLTATDLENTCDSGQAFALSGTYQPIESLSVFSGIDPNGVWFLDVEDYRAGNGGEIINWALDICSSAVDTATLVLVNDTFYVNKGAALAITDEYLFTEDANPEAVRYIVNSLPAFGDLQLMDDAGNMTTLSVGNEFSQADVIDGRFVFQSDDLETEDSFMFDVLNSAGVWLPDNIFDIKIYGPSATVDLGFDLDIAVMPNPGNGIYTLKFEGHDPTRLAMTILSVDGKLVNTDAIEVQHGSEYLLDLTDQANGTYILVMRNDKGERNTYTLVKQ